MSRVVRSRPRIAAAILVVSSLGCGARAELGSPSPGLVCGRGTNEEMGQCLPDAVGRPASRVDASAAPIADAGAISAVDADTGTDAGGPAIGLDCITTDDVLVLAGDPDDSLHPGPLTVSDPNSYIASVPSTDGSGVVSISLRVGNWTMAFTSTSFIEPLRVATYVDTQLAGAQAQGHPGLSVSAAGNAACATVTGSFEIDRLDVQRTDAGAASVGEITARFEQHCNGASAALRGCVHFKR